MANHSSISAKKTPNGVREKSDTTEMISPLSSRTHILLWENNIYTQIHTGLTVEWDQENYLTKMFYTLTENLKILLFKARWKKKYIHLLSR